LDYNIFDYLHARTTQISNLLRSQVSAFVKAATGIPFVIIVKVGFLFILCSKSFVALASE